MPVIEVRSPGQNPPVAPVTEGWATTNAWTTSWTTQTTISTIVVPPCTTTTTPVVPVITTSPAAVVVIHHNSGGGLSPGAVGGIILGVFFGVFLLFLLCIFCFRSWRRSYYVDDSSTDSHSSHHRRRPRPIDPYPDRPGATLTFLGGGNRPETKVVITKSQRVFIRPARFTEERTIRTKERVVVVEDE